MHSFTPFYLFHLFRILYNNRLPNIEVTANDFHIEVFL